jgi:hypothetical protein
MGYTRYGPILEQPLRVIGGASSLHRSMTLFAHVGYDHFDGMLRDPEHMMMLLGRTPPGHWLVRGSLDNPLSSWPLYAKVEERCLSPAPP